ncbi:hypothetical protein NDU88_001724 [Pleurodeles waltl]|uniref:Retrotransposon gag domain-containing protein n=1 Tax=Pleurodeles waltl TaxID=8319 RepID=A0AAV7VB80_PLEWA|nr:hypothetical protein NDU88_001724 [Pleurodeles waltl]
MRRFHHLGIKECYELQNVGIEGKNIYESPEELQVGNGRGEPRDANDISVKMLEEHFGLRINVVPERQKLFTRTQAKQERLGNYVARLRSLARTCVFGKLTDSLLKDQLVRCMNESRGKVAGLESNIKNALDIVEGMVHTS